MKDYIFVVFIMAFVFTLSGCAENQTRIGEGAAIGGGLGVLAGGIIGHQTHSDVAGILIGGAVGAAGGAAVGVQIPKHNQMASNSSQPSSKVTMQQVVDWSKQGLPGDEIISRIRTASSTYALTADDVNYLRKEGVSERVIEAMQATR